MKAKPVVDDKDAGDAELINARLDYQRCVQLVKNNAMEVQSLTKRKDELEASIQKMMNDVSQQFNYSCMSIDEIKRHAEHIANQRAQIDVLNEAKNQIERDIKTKSDTRSFDMECKDARYNCWMVVYNSLLSKIDCKVLAQLRAAGFAYGKDLPMIMNDLFAASISYDWIDQLAAHYDIPR